MRNIKSLDEYKDEPCSTLKKSEKVEKTTESTNTNSGFWIHRIEAEKLKQLHNKKYLGAKTKKSQTIEPIQTNDRIIIVTNQGSGLEFIAYTQVGSIEYDDEVLYKTLKSRKKLKLKGIKYFSDPIFLKDIKEELSFIKNVNNAAGSLKSEYKSIPEGDFRKLHNSSNLIKDFPAYLENISFSQNDFILITIKTLFNFIKKTHESKQIEILKFLSLLKDILNEYGINKSIKDLEKFYGLHANELNFRHVPSRNPEKQIKLINPLGKKVYYAYISLNE